MENRVKDFSRILQSCFYFLDICKLHETMIFSILYCCDLMENGGIAELSMHCTNTVHLKFFIISFKRRQVHVFIFTDICLSKKHLGLRVVRFYH